MLEQDRKETRNGWKIPRDDPRHKLLSLFFYSNCSSLNIVAVVFFVCFVFWLTASLIYRILTTMHNVKVTGILFRVNVMPGPFECLLHPGTCTRYGSDLKKIKFYVSLFSSSSQSRRGAYTHLATPPIRLGTGKKEEIRESPPKQEIAQLL